MLQRREAFLAVINLTGLVVFAADDHEDLLGRERLQADVVIGIERVPIEGVGKHAAR